MFIAVWLGITYFWNMTVREWVIVTDASEQASGIFTLKIRKRCVENSEDPITKSPKDISPYPRRPE